MFGHWTIICRLNRPTEEVLSQFIGGSCYNFRYTEYIQQYRIPATVSRYFYLHTQASTLFCRFGTACRLEAGARLVHLYSVCEVWGHSYLWSLAFRITLFACLLIYLHWFPDRHRPRIIADPTVSRCRSFLRLVALDRHSGAIFGTSAASVTSDAVAKATGCCMALCISASSAAQQRFNNNARLLSSRRRLSQL